MKKILLFLILIISGISQAQNLVNNWSFEDTVSCPTYLDDIDLSVGWSSYSQSPDYFNSCSSFMGVPFNDVGFQYARTGNAYAGFITYAKNSINYREIIGTQLSQTLIIGQKYFVTFYVNRAFNSANPSFNATHLNAATNKIGARFSTVSHTYPNYIFIDNYAQIYSDSLINDTLNWVKISGSFIADSSYKYVCFGNFFTDSATIRILFDTIASFAYYYIDDIKVSNDSDFVNSINEINVNRNNIIIFPNPARDWIEIEGSGIKSFSIFDVFGRKYIDDAFAPTSLKTIDIGNLSKGIYFIHINTLNNSSIKKLIIQ